MRMRSDLIVYPLQLGGRRYWGIKDPVSLRYWQFREEEYAILRMLDGQSGFEDIQARFERQFTPRRLNLQHLHAFCSLLHREGLIVSPAAGQGPELLARRNNQRRQAWQSALLNPLALRLPGFDPSRLLNVLYAGFRWLFSPWCVAACGLLIVAALVQVVVHLDALLLKLPQFGAFFAAENAIWLAVALATAKILHELGHALVCKHFGGECHEMGVMLLAFTPCLYCNVSDAWSLPNKWHRTAIGAAGIYVDLVLAAICTFLWWYSEPGLLNALCLNLMFVCSISTLIFNGNPLLRYDGYYVLSDLVEIPNLRQQASEVVQRSLSRWFLGHDPQPGRFLTPLHRTLLGIYGAASSVYMWLVTFAILWFFNKLGERFRLEPVAQFVSLLVLVSLAGGLVMTVWRMVQQARLSRQARWSRFLVRGGLTAAIVAAIVGIPLPCRVAAPVVVEPQSARRVYVTVPGKLVEAVEEGQVVQSGAIVARLESPDVQMQLAKLQGQRNQLRMHLTNLQRRQGGDAVAAAQIPAAREQLADVEQRLQRRLEDQQRLVLTAPVSGTVIPATSRHQPQDAGQLPNWSGTPLQLRNQGSYLETGTTLCLIGDPQRLEAVLVVDQADIEFVAPEQSVRLILDQLPGVVLSGSVLEIAQRDLKIAPRQLLTSAELPIEADDLGRPRPLSTSYQVRVSLDPHQHRVLVGSSGQAKIRVVPQSLAHRVHRFLTRTFRFEL